MWAGSRLHWTRAFVVGSTVTRDYPYRQASARKSGRSGDMVFVTLAHQYRDADGPAAREEHDIVYRDWPTDAEKAALAALGARGAGRRTSLRAHGRAAAGGAWPTR